MQERIRANPRGAEAYDCTSYASGPAVLGCVSRANCTARELAEDDLAEWQRAVRRALPAVKPDTCAANVMYAAGDASQPARYQVSVSWQQRDESLTYRSELLLSAAPPS
jgi:hypothetical protein